MIDRMMIFSFCHSIVGLVGMVFNSFLVYLAVFQTPKVIKSYSLLIINFGLADFFTCLTDMFVQQRMIPAGVGLGYVSNGFCKYFSPNACYVGYSLMLHFHCHSLYSLLLSFSYRYYILIKPAPSSTKLILIIIFIYTPALIQFVVFLWAQDDPSEIRVLLRQYYPTYELDAYTVTGTKNIICFSCLFPILHMSVPVTPVYITILIIRRKIISSLSANSKSLSSNTKKLHRQLLMALSIQAVLPVLFAISVASYIIGQLGIYNHEVLEYITYSAVLFIQVFSPVTSFVFVTPYRRFIAKLFCRRVDNKKMSGVETSISMNQISKKKKISSVANF